MPHDPADTTPIRLLIVGDTFPPNVNGAAKFTVNLAAEMARLGHDVHVAVPAASRRHGEWDETYNGQRIRVHRLPSDRWYLHDWLRYVKPWRARAYLSRIIDEVQPDVIHYQSAVVLGRAAVIEGAKRGIRIIGTNHLMLDNMLDHTGLIKPLRDLGSAMWWADARKTFAHTAALTTPTRRAADFLQHNGHLGHVLAISCGIRVSDYTPDIREKDVPHILFVGRITGEKHIEDLLHAFAKLPTELDARLDIVGGGDQKSNLEKLSKQLQIDDRTIFHGYASDEDLKRLYTEATVFAMPSTAELQSIATMEAMSSGLPVVAADAMALPHLVHEGVNGFLFQPHDVERFTQLLEEVITMPQADRAQLAHNGLEMVKDHDIDTTMALFERLYRGESIEDVALDSKNEQDHSLDDVVEPVTGSIPRLGPEMRRRRR